MHSSLVTALHRRLLANLSGGTTDLAESEMRVPAAVFTSEEVHLAERRALFSETPQPVAFSGEIPAAGSFLALDVLDTPVLLTRDHEGRLRGFINACAHRGAPLASGSGQAKTLVCPFHGWAYTPAGTLRGRPGDESFRIPLKDSGLIPLPVSERAGVVMVSLKRETSQAIMDDALSELEQELADMNFHRYQLIERRQREVDANWKLVNDLSLESYHFQALHRDSVARILAPNAVCDRMGRHSRWAFPLKSIEALAHIDERDWPQTFQGSCTYTLYPGVMVIINALGAQMIRAEPADNPGHCRVTYIGMCAEHCDMAEATAACHFGGDVFEGEDLPMAEACQRGIAAGGRDLVLGRNEPLLQFWHELWQQALD